MAYFIDLSNAIWTFFLPFASFYRHSIIRALLSGKYPFCSQVQSCQKTLSKIDFDCLFFVGLSVH